MTQPWAWAVPFPPWQWCHLVIPHAEEPWQSSQGSTRGTSRDVAAIKHLLCSTGSTCRVCASREGIATQTYHNQPIFPPQPPDRTFKVFPEDIIVCKGKMTWHSYLDMIKFSGIINSANLYISPFQKTTFLSEISTMELIQNTNFPTWR